MNGWRVSKLQGKLHGNYMLKENDLEELKDFSQARLLLNRIFIKIILISFRFSLLGVEGKNLARINQKLFSNFAQDCDDSRIK